MHSSPAVRGMGGSARKTGGKRFSIDLNPEKANDELINFLE